MDDWRIPKESEKLYDEHYKRIQLLQIIFPEFWQRALKTKNNFFKFVYAEAENYVEKLGTGAEYLTEELCCKWWDRRCNFCLKTITTDLQEECYCSEDDTTWVCAECFNDFKDRFEWDVQENAQDIPTEGFTALKEIVANTKDKT